MQPWKKAPLLRIALPLIAGIIFAIYCDFIPLLQSLSISILFLGAFICSHIFSAGTGYKYRWLPGVFMSSLVFFTGYSLLINREIYRKTDFFAKNLYRSEFLELRISEPIQQKEKTYKCIAEVKSGIYKEKPGTSQKYIREKCSGKLLLYFSKTPKAASIKYGDVILIKTIPERLYAPKNPGEFDYRHFMVMRNVYHSTYLTEENYILTGKNEGNSLWKAMYETRATWGKYIRENIGGKDEQAIARALILGDEGELSPDVVSDYAASGTLHVLSVSGLHIGVIFLVLNFLLGFLQRNRAGRISRIILMLSLLWAYALLTGLSPAVCRSVAMFSFVLIGRDMRRISSIYNSMAASVVALLLWDPFLIMQVGFQLSYVALTGIVWLYPYIYKWVNTEVLLPPPHSGKTIKYLRKGVHKTVQAIWSLTAVSLAAQIAVFPLGILYFNQFPIYFLLSNLIVIPLSSIILIGGCLFIVIRLLHIQFLYSITGKILYAIIHFMNFFVSREHGIPHSQIEGVYFSNAECVLVYVAMFLLIAALVYKYKNMLKISLGLFLVFFSVRLAAETKSYPKSECIVHSISHCLAISIKENNRLFVLADSTFIHDKNKMNYYISRHAFEEFIPPKNIRIFNVDSTFTFSYGAIFISGNTGQFHNKKFIILKHNYKLDSMKPMTDIDFIVMHDNPDISIEKLLEKTRPGKIIINANNSRYKAEKWENECIRNNISYTNLKKDNSFVVSPGNN